MEGCKNFELVQATQCIFRLLFLEDQLEFMPQARATDARKEIDGFGNEVLGSRIDAKSKTLFEAGGAKDAGRVFDKTKGVQDANDAVFQVFLTVVEIQ